MTDDPEARFRALFEQHRRAVLAYARRRVDADAAAEVVADTFLVAWRRLDAVPADPLPWLYGVARKVIANRRRAQRRSIAVAERVARETAAAAPAPDELIGGAFALRAALAVLSERDREALRLVAWEGLEPADAARAAGCSRATFAVRLHRARRRLAAALEVESATPAPVRPLEATHDA